MNTSPSSGMNVSPPSGMNVSPPSGMNASPTSGMNASPPSGMMDASPASLTRGPAKPLSLTMLAGYIIAGVVLIGLIVMVVLYIKKPSDCNGDKTDCSATCPEDNTGLKWDASSNKCTVADDWSDVTGMLCPKKCKLADSVNALCPYGYWANNKDLLYDTRTSSSTGPCVQDQSVDGNCHTRGWKQSANKSQCCPPSKDGTLPDSCDDLPSSV